MSDERDDELRLPAAIRRWLRREGATARELVRRMGYRNEAKGLRRLQAWLRGEALPLGDQPDRLAGALGLSGPALQRLLQHDAEVLRAAARARRGRDPRYYLTTRYFAGFYATQALPDGVGEAQALRQARAQARRRGLRCCLDTPDNRQVWIGADGELEHVTEGRGPWMSVGGARFRVVVD